MSGLLDRLRWLSGRAPAADDPPSPGAKQVASPREKEDPWRQVFDPKCARGAGGRASKAPPRTALTLPAPLACRTLPQHQPCDEKGGEGLLRHR